MEELKNVWIRPWEQTLFDNIYDKDTRFFSLVIKGCLAYLTRNIKLYNKSINHYIVDTGSEYLYVENNGYEFSWNKTSGEGTLYSKLPRCTAQFNQVQLVKDELTAPYSRGYYEREVDGQLKAFSSEIKRMPLTMQCQLSYRLSNFNEGIILMQELIDKLVWLKYYNINYLGQQILCSIEFTDNLQIEFNQPTFGTESKDRIINVSLTIRTSYPIINVRTEIPADKVISKFIYETDSQYAPLDYETKIVE